MKNLADLDSFAYNQNAMAALRNTVLTGKQFMARVHETELTAIWYHRGGDSGL